jgi:hypothetical protein
MGDETMKIYDVSHADNDKNRFCGPSAISALTGMSSGEAARLLRHVTGLRSIKGSDTGPVRRALLMCGIHTSQHYVPTESYKNKKGKIKTRGVMSLAAWFKKSVRIRTTGRVFLIVAGNHWQVVTGRRFVCGIVGKIVSITDKKVKRRAKVTEIWECVPVASGVTIPAVAKKQAKTLDWIGKLNRITYSKFRKFVRENGLQYSIYPEAGNQYIAIQPTPFWPDGLEFLHYDFGETMARLETCFENPSLVEDGYYSE